MIIIYHTQISSLSLLRLTVEERERERREMRKEGKKNVERNERKREEEAFHSFIH